MHSPLSLWKILVMAVVGAGAVMWAVSYLSVVRLAHLVDQMPGIVMEARYWSTARLGKVGVKGFRVYQEGETKAIFEGDFDLRYDPQQVWWGREQKIFIEGRGIKSDVLVELLNLKPSTSFIETFTSDVVIRRHERISIQRVHVQGKGVDGKISGSVNFQGDLDLAATWILDRRLLMELPDMEAVTSFLNSSSEPSSQPDSTKVDFVLEGNIQHPHVRLRSDLFQIELG